MPAFTRLSKKKWGNYKSEEEFRHKESHNVLYFWGS